MSKILKNALPLVVFATMVLGVGVAFAQDEPPQPPYGRGLMADYQDGIHQALADALGMSLADLEAARSEGQTLADLAEAHDVELSALSAVMNAARAEAIAQAVEDGALTQDQADWMLSHQVARRGAGICDASSARQGRGMIPRPTIQGFVEGRGMIPRPTIQGFMEGRQTMGRR